MAIDNSYRMESVGIVLMIKPVWAVAKNQGNSSKKMRYGKGEIPLFVKEIFLG